MSMDEANFWNDQRTLEGMLPKRVKVLEDQGTQVRVVIDLGDVEVEAVVPLVFAVCAMCRGKGKVINPAIDASGLTSEDFERDPDLLAEVRSMKSTVTCGCPACSGKRVVPDLPALLRHFPRHVGKQLRALIAEDREYAKLCASERAYGC